MSLVITNQPQVFQPTLSDGVFFTVTADTTNTYKFRYVYELYVEDELVFAGKCTPNPEGVGIIDLQQVLYSYTENNPISLWDTTPIYTHQTFPFSRPYENEVINYFCRFGYEYSDTAIGQVTGFTGVGNQVGSPGFESSVYKVFRSTMGVNGNANEQDFNINPFVLSGTPVGVNPTTTGLFLTNSPRNRDIDPSEYYTLAFTNYYMGLTTGTTLSEPYYVKYTFYDEDGVEITGKTYDNIVSNGGGPRTDCNHVYQQYYLIDPISGTTDYNTLYVGSGPRNIPDFPSNCAQYTVQLFGHFTGTTTPIQPSPTPTPSSSPGASVTPTPSTTPQCATCTEYTMIYTGDCESIATVTITNCSTGLSQNMKLNCGVYYNVCSCTFPFADPSVNITVGGACGVSPTPSATPSPTPTPSQTQFTMLGRTAVDGTDGPDACSKYLTARSYIGTKLIYNITVGDFIYDVYPSSPTNGGGNWVALKQNGTGPSYSFQIDTNGEVLDTYTC